MELKPLIKEYWQDKQPNIWYSKEEIGTKQYYDKVEKLRYNKYYPHIPKIANFEGHMDEKILEIGVGIGTDLKQYAKNFAICYGVDLTEGAIEQTRKHLGTFNLTANLQVMDAEDLRFDDNTLDLIYSFGVLHHTPDTKKAIGEIKRVLKPNSKAIVMLYSKSWQHYIIRIGVIGILKGELRKMSVQELINKYSEAYGFSPLTKLYNKKEIKELFKDFKEVHITHYHYKDNFFQWKSGYYMGNWIIKATK